MKKIMFFTILSMLAFGLSGCSKNNSENKKDEELKQEQNITPIANTITPSITSGAKIDTSANTVSETDFTPDSFVKLSGERAYSVGFSDDGDMFIVRAPSSGNGTLCKVSAAGELTEICKVEGEFIGPGMYINPDKNIYIPVGKSVKKFTEKGESVIFSDDFKNALDIACDSNNNLYVTDEIGETVYKILPTGEKEVFADFTPKTGKRFNLGGVEYSPKDDCLYIMYNKSIYKYPVNTTLPAQGEIVYTSDKNLFCLAVNEAGDIYAGIMPKSILKLDHDTYQVSIFNSTGNSMEYDGLSFGKKDFGENSLYITSSQEIIKFDTNN